MSFAAVTIGLTESLIKAAEGAGFVEVCAELMKGDLRTAVSLTIEAVRRNVSAGMYIVSNMYVCSKQNPF